MNPSMKQRICGKHRGVPLDGPNSLRLEKVEKHPEKSYLAIKWKIEMHKKNGPKNTCSMLVTSILGLQRPSTHLMENGCFRLSSAALVDRQGGGGCSGNERARQFIVYINIKYIYTYVCVFLIYITFPYQYHSTAQFLWTLKKHIGF